MDSHSASKSSLNTMKMIGELLPLLEQRYKKFMEAVDTSNLAPEVLDHLLDIGIELGKKFEDTDLGQYVQALEEIHENKDKSFKR